jgi:DNA-binding transcriptional LysR family regulator
MTGQLRSARCATRFGSPQLPALGTPPSSSAPAVRSAVFEPDLRHRSNDADVQLDLVRAAGAVALLPRLTLPNDDPTLAIRDIVGATINRRLMILTRDISLTPALDHFLATITAQLPD